MIQFVAAKFINWHYIQESAILPMSGSIFITGLNKAGKSTLLDALQFAALVQTDGFNQAANNDTSKRTPDRRDLISYGRGMITMTHDEDGKAEKKSFLRTSVTTSHVIIQMRDNTEKKDILLGASLEFGDYAVNPNKCKRVWWLAKGRKISDVNFFKTVNGGRAVLTVAELEKQFPMDKYETQRDIKCVLSYLFGLTRNRLGDVSAFDSWVKVMHSSIFCDTNQMSDMNRFLKDYVFPEHKVSLEHLNEAIETLQQFRSQLDQMKENLAILHSIEETYKLYQERERDILNSELRQKLLTYNVNQEAMKRYQLTIDTNNPKIASIGQELSDLDQKLEQVNQRIGKLSASMSVRDDIQRELAQVERDLISLTRQRKALQEGADKAWNFITSIDKLLGRRLKDLPVINEMRGESCTADIQAVAAASTGLEQYSEEFHALKQREQQEAQDISSQLADVKRTIQRLERQELGEAKHREVKRIISEAFQAAGIQGQPVFFCELLEWVDTDFQMAIESHLGQDRFNIFVPPNGYNAAVKAYKDYTKTHPECYGVKIVDTRYYVTVRRPAKEGSLATALTTTRSDAKFYLDDRFGNIMLVDDAANPPDKGVTSIDRNGMRYSGNTYTKMRPVQDMLIGQKAIKALLRKKKEEEQKLQKRQEQSSHRMAAITTLSSILRPVDQFRTTCADIYTQIQRIPVLMKQKQEKERELAEQDKKPEAAQIKAAEQERTDLSRQRKEKQKEQTDLQMEVKRATDSISACQANMARIDTASLEQAHPQEYAEAKVYADKNMYRHQQAAKELEDSREKNLTYLRQNEVEIHSLEEQYARLSEGDWSTGGIADVQEYLDEHKRLARSEWPNLQNKVITAQESLNQTFKRNVLHEMHAAFMEMAHTINNLNFILSKKPLNDTIFEFCKPVARAGKEAIFQMIKSENNTTDSGAQESIFANNMDSEFAEAQEEFFQELAACTTEKEKAEILDYRRYCKFRILKKSVSDPTKKADLAETFGINSGSENQVPCYIILAAALINRYNQGSHYMIDRSESIRLMMIDEAFNNMDEKNTKDLVRFLSQDLGLQLIIAAPSDKIDRLGVSANNVWMVQSNEQLHQRQVMAFSFYEYEQRGKSDNA